MKARLFLLLSFLSIGLHAQCDLITPLKEEGFENLIQVQKGEPVHHNKHCEWNGQALGWRCRILNGANYLS